MIGDLFDYFHFVGTVLGALLNILDGLNVIYTVGRFIRWCWSLVPKLYLGTHLSAKLCFPRAEATKLRGHLRSQVQLGNEGGTY